MLMRYADFTDRDVSDRAELDSFVDANTVPGWSEEALEWAVAEGILHGRTGNVLDPTGLCTRAEAATILVRFAGL